MHVNRPHAHEVVWGSCIKKKENEYETRLCNGVYEVNQIENKTETQVCVDESMRGGEGGGGGGGRFLCVLLFGLVW
jgi:hypothetical protein